jgi:microcystin-dependent protein
VSIGRVSGVYKNRLGCTVSTTVVGNDVVKLILVDAFVVDFDEDGGQFLHQPTGDIYTYASADIENETITLATGLPTGKTLTVDDALYVVRSDGSRADDYYADVEIDDVATDTVHARVPQELRAILAEGAKEHRKGPLVRLAAGAEEWHITELVGDTPVISTGNFETGDWKICGWAVSGGGVLIDGGWLKADGTAVSRATYAALFNRYGTLYGVGDGATTFNLPDARGRAIFGAGTVVALGATDGHAESTRGPGHKHGIVAGGSHGHGFTQADLNQLTNTAIAGAQTRLTGPNPHDHGFTNATDHSHGGETQGGLTSSDPFSYIGANILVKT